MDVLGIEHVRTSAQDQAGRMTHKMVVCSVPGHLQLLSGISRAIYQRKAEELQVFRGLQLLLQCLGASCPVLQNRQNKITAYRQKKLRYSVVWLPVHRTVLQFIGTLYQDFALNFMWAKACCLQRGGHYTPVPLP